MLEQLNGEGHMYATDVDPEESARTRKRLADLGFGEDILTIKLQNFCTIDEIARETGGFDFLLADLGVSSMQIDNPKRGFSFKIDGPLDLRLNQKEGISAASRLEHISREELAGMFYENSDEPYSDEIAKAITEYIRRGNHVDTTTKRVRSSKKRCPSFRKRIERTRSKRHASVFFRHFGSMSTMNSRFSMNLWKSCRTP